jgi:protein-tyrosine-phosphatase
VLVRSAGAQHKVHLLKTYGLQQSASPNGPDIPDPIGKPLEVYEVCFSDIKTAVERLVSSL